MGASVLASTLVLFFLAARNREVHARRNVHFDVDTSNCIRKNFEQTYRTHQALDWVLTKS